MSNISMVTFGNAHYLGNEINKGYYSLTVPISLFATNDFRQCLKPFNNSFSVDGSKLNTVLEEIKEGINAQTLCVQPLLLYCDSLHIQDDYVGVVANSIFTPREDILLSYQALGSLGNKLQVPLLLQAIQRNCVDKLVFLNEIVANNDLTTTNGDRETRLICNNIIHCNLMSMYSKVLSENVLHDVVALTLRNVDSVPLLTANGVDVFIENKNALKTQLEQYAVMPSLMPIHINNVSWNVFNYIVKFLQDSPNMQTVRRKLKLIKESQVATLFENKKLTKSVINKMVVDINNDVNIVTEEALKHSDEMFNFSEYKLPFLQSIIDGNDKDDLSNRVKNYIDVFSRCKPFEVKNCKDLFFFTKKELLEVVSDYVKSGGIYHYNLRNRIKDYFQYCVDYGLANKSIMENITCIKPKDYLSQSVNSTQDKFYHSASDTVTAFNYLFSISKNDSTMAQICAYQLFLLIGYTYEDSEKVLVSNYTQLLREGLTVELFGETYFLEDIYNGCIGILDEWAEIKLHIEKIKDAPELFYKKIFISQNAIKFEAMIKTMNANKVLNYEVNTKVKTVTALRKLFAYLVAEKYIKVHNIDVSDNQASNHKDVVQIIMDILQIKVDPRRSVPAQIFRKFTEWHTNTSL